MTIIGFRRKNIGGEELRERYVVNVYLLMSHCLLSEFLLDKAIVNFPSHNDRPEQERWTL